MNSERAAGFPMWRLAENSAGLFWTPDLSQGQINATTFPASASLVRKKDDYAARTLRRHPLQVAHPRTQSDKSLSLGNIAV